ncbi:hypothetical protein BC941DRAFT_79693 [Chlamydoabsidia padenii]|nr:hypothetical protein BC941DRAFT_79693 [Chlamydoabsidia padenii]
MTELHSTNNGFSNIDWLDRHNMNSSTSNATTYNQQQQQQSQEEESQQQGSYNMANTNDPEVANRLETYYSHQLPPINSISTPVPQLDHESIHLTDEERKEHQQQQQQQQQQLVSWDMPSATTTTDSTLSTSSSTYDPYHHHHHTTTSTPSPSISTERSSSTSNNRKQLIQNTKDMHVEKNTEGKPPYSYATLIKYAIENSPDNKMTLSEIYHWVIEHYPYYSTAGSGWKVGRHPICMKRLTDMISFL